MRHALVLLLALASAVTAHADWPMARHDPARTALNTDPSDLARPAIAWSRYLGGLVTNGHMATVDTDGDGVAEVMYVAGGRLVMKEADDRLVWESPPLDIDEIVAITDLNGDDSREVVASGSPGAVHVLDIATGRSLWRTADDAFGTSLNVRIADFDRDGKDDLYIADMGCGVPDRRGDLGYVHHFADGFGDGVDDGSTLLYSIETGRDYWCTRNDAIADMTGDGVPDIVALGTTHIYLYDGRDGTKISSGLTANRANGGYPIGFSLPYSQARTIPVNVDDDMGLELVGMTNEAYDPSINSRALFVIDYDVSRPTAERAYTKWVRAVADLTADQHTFVLEAVSDLDRDGQVEIVSTFREGGVATTYFFDAETGAVKANMASTVIHAIVERPAPALPLVFVTRGMNTSAFTFASFVSPTMELDPTMLNVARGFDIERVAPGTPRKDPMWWSTPTGIEIVASTNNSVVLFRIEAGAAVELARYDLPAGITVQALAPQHGVLRKPNGVLVTRSDGYLVVLDERLVPINFGDGEIPLPGIRVGGYYSGRSDLGNTPAIGRLGDPFDAIVVRDSRGVMLRLDASAARPDTDPRIVWEWPSVLFPAIADVLPAEGVEVIARDQVRIRVRSADAMAEHAVTPMLAGRARYIYDVVPIHAGSASRLAAAVNDAGDGSGWVVVHEAIGTEAWSSDPIVVAGSGQGALAAGQLDGDTTDDVIGLMQSPLRWFNGTTGGLVASSPPTFSTLPIVTSGMAGSTQVIAAASFHPPAAFSLAANTFTQTWAIPDFDGETVRASRVLGAIAQCDDGLVFVQAQYQSSRVIVVDADDGANLRDAYLGEGMIRPTVGEPFSTILGNASATTALYEGQPAVLIGGSDGYLYAIDPCEDLLRLLWAIDLRAPVGEPTFGDTDGDGSDEIVVSAADGFLYGIDSEALARPDPVLDIDPDWGIDDEDVDVTRGRAIVASWPAVTGATGYEFAVYTEEGTPVSRNPDNPANPFIATTTTRAEHFDGLAAGQRYYVVVRATSDRGSSGESRSDGTMYMPELPPRPDASVDASVDASSDAARDAAPMGDDDDDGCGCGVGGARRNAAWVLVAIAWLLSARRRRRCGRASRP